MKKHLLSISLGIIAIIEAAILLKNKNKKAKITEPKSLAAFEYLQDAGEDEFNFALNTDYEKNRDEYRLGYCGWVCIDILYTEKDITLSNIFSTIITDIVGELGLPEFPDASVISGAWQYLKMDLKKITLEGLFNEGVKHVIHEFLYNFILLNIKEQELDEEEEETTYRVDLGNGCIMEWTKPSGEGD